MKALCSIACRTVSRRNLGIQNTSRRFPKTCQACCVRTRLGYAFVGGAVMGFGTRLARGCTSGLALSGGALLSAGAWVFMLAIFAAGYAVAPLVRRQWT